MVEQAKYEVVRNLGKVEIRSYPRMTIARVEGYGDGGFNLLFRYITGKNRQKSKVSMTAPVVAERISMTAPVLAETDSLAFVLPEKYKPDTAPQPLDDHVHIVEVPPRVVAALQFSGRWSTKIFAKKASELLKDLKEAGIKTLGNVFSMRYNGPFTLWFMRRNEVAIVVKPK
jgi:hypothetical protein